MTDLSLPPIATWLPSPVGDLIVAEMAGALTHLAWGRVDAPIKTALLAEAMDQLDAYFAGRLTSFDLPLAPAGTPFQQRVWQVMREIPYGQTLSYGEVAQCLDSAPRAVGGACGRNPIAVIIPCHRILAAHRTIGGYSGAGGRDTKRTLLELERARLAPAVGRRRPAQPDLFVPPDLSA